MPYILESGITEIQIEAFLTMAKSQITLQSQGDSSKFEETKSSLGIPDG